MKNRNWAIIANIRSVTSFKHSDTIAIFMRFGNTPFCSDESNEYLRGPQSSPKQCLITLKFISSAPGILFVFRGKRHPSVRLLTETDWAR